MKGSEQIMKKNDFHENSEIEFLKNKQKRKGTSSKFKKKKASGLSKTFRVVLIFILIIAVALLGVFTYFKRIYKPDHLNDDSGNLGVLSEVIDGNTGDKISLDSGVYTFLATGCDKSEGLTDVIMTATYNLNENKLSIMSIPRDTYVKLNNTLKIDENGAISVDNFNNNANSAGKINSAYSKGRRFAERELQRLVEKSEGLSDAQIKKLCEESFLNINLKTLKNYINETNTKKKNEIYENVRKEFGIKYLSMLIYYNFGIPIDFYAQVNISGFRNIVDAIGGVDVVIQQDMYYYDPTQDLKINLKKGPQHLDGEKAEQFVRYRSGYISADIGRIDAQKIFMTAFIKKLFSFTTVTKLNTLVEEIQNNLTTNLSVSDAAYFGTNALELDLANINMITLPGISEYVDDISYYSVNKAAVIETVNTYLNKYDKPLPETNFCMTQISNKVPVGTGVLTADDITKDEPALDYVWGNSRSNTQQATDQPHAVQIPTDQNATAVENQQSETETTSNPDNHDVENTDDKAIDTSSSQNNPTDTQQHDNISQDSQNTEQETIPEQQIQENETAEQQDVTDTTEESVVPQQPQGNFDEIQDSDELSGIEQLIDMRT